MKSLRWSAVGVLAAVVLLVPARAARADTPVGGSPAQCTLGSAGSGLGDLVATDTIGYWYYSPWGSESVSGSAAVAGIAQGGIGIANHSSATVNDPTITVSSGLDPSAFGGTLPSSGLPSSCSLPGLAPGDSMSMSGLSWQVGFSLGYDSAFAWSPHVLPPGGGELSEQLTIELTDPSLAGSSIHLFGNYPAGSFSYPTNLDDGETTCDLACGGSSNVYGLQVGKSYTFTWSGFVDDPFGAPESVVPSEMQILLSPSGATDGACTACQGLPAPSLTIPEPSLDGSTSGLGALTYSVAEGDHVWSADFDGGPFHGRTTRYRGGLFPPPAVTVAASPSPALGSQPVTYAVTVVGSGELGTDFPCSTATPHPPDGVCPPLAGSVTVSDGAGGSCSIPSLDSGAGSCSIVEAAAVDPYTVTASYSGDEIYLPATGSTTETFLMPTSTDRCKQGGWRRFGLFGNQGDCVSYVASGGKNPPSGG